MEAGELQNIAAFLSFSDRLGCCLPAARRALDVADAVSILVCRRQIMFVSLRGNPFKSELDSLQADAMGVGDLPPGLDAVQPSAP